MKTVLYTTIALFCLLTGCKKDDSSNTTGIGLQPKLQYYANGTLVNFDATRDAQLGWKDYPQIYNYVSSIDNAPVFELGTSEGATLIRHNYVHLFITSNPSLSVSTYNYQNTRHYNISLFLGISYGCDNFSNYNVTITQIKDSLVSGTFTANLPACYSSYANLQITNGTFSNLPIRKN